MWICKILIIQLDGFWLFIQMMWASQSETAFNRPSPIALKNFMVSCLLDPMQFWDMDIFGQICSQSKVEFAWILKDKFHRWDYKEGQALHARSIASFDLPTFVGIYRRCYFRIAVNIIKDPRHLGYPLILLLPSVRKCRSLKTETTRLWNRFGQQPSRFWNTNLNNHALYLWLFTDIGFCTIMVINSLIFIIKFYLCVLHLQAC